MFSAREAAQQGNFRKYLLRCGLFGGRDHQDDNSYRTDYLWAPHGFREPFLGSHSPSPMIFMFTHCSCNEPWLSCEFCDGKMELVGCVHPFLCFRPGYCGHLGVHDLFSRQLLNEPYVLKENCRLWNAQQH